MHRTVSVSARYNYGPGRSMRVPERRGADRGGFPLLFNFGIMCCIVIQIHFIKWNHTVYIT